MTLKYSFINYMELNMNYNELTPLFGFGNICLPTALFFKIK